MSTVEESDLRQRKRQSVDLRNSDPKKLEDTVKTYLRVIEDKVPETYKSKVMSLAPTVVAIILFVQHLIPIAYEWYFRVSDFIVTLKPYKLHLLLPAFCGFILCFFGGSYVTLIGAVEAYRLIGYQTTVDSLQHIYDDFQLFINENKKDDEVDADGDGIADVNEEKSSKLVVRKTLLFLRTVNPERLNAAINAITSGWFAIIFILKYIKIPN